jgi:hypothetical protein
MKGWAGWVVLALCAQTALAQVSLEDALAPEKKGKAEAQAPADSKAPTAALPCRREPGGCNTKFKPVAESLLPQWFADQEKTPPQAQAAKERVSAYLKRYHDTLVKGGGEANDVGRAYAYFVAVLYLAYANGQEPNLAQFKVLVQRCQAELANDPQFHANTDRDKQFIYERMIVIAMNNEDAVNFARARGDRALEGRHRARARDWLEDVTKRTINNIPSMWQ